VVALAARSPGKISAGWLPALTGAGSARKKRNWRAVAGKYVWWLAAGLILAQVAGCATGGGGGGFGTSRQIDPVTQPAFGETSVLPAPQGQVVGTGPVRVALLLPLSGDPGLAQVGQSMGNAATLAMEAIGRSTGTANNIHLVIKDTGGNAVAARNAAAAAITEGARLIIGPLQAASVQAAGGVARASGVPLIGFSNNSGAASQGIYLLNVLPETEALRSVGYAMSLGRKSFAVVTSRTSSGEVNLAAFRAAASQLGANVTSIFQFDGSSEEDFRNAVSQLIPLIQTGVIDALYLPERLFAPSAAVLMESAQLDKSTFTILGSADWDGDVKVAQTAFLDGALFPAVDPAGYDRLSRAYQTQFGMPPHRLATLASTAVKLANHSLLAGTNPPYQTDQLINSRGFLGDDGGVRFFRNGTNIHQLVIKRLQINGGPQVVDGLKYPPIGR